MKNHLAADIFPMMSDAELGVLCRDIKENGLNQPIITLDGMIVDGRSQSVACLGACVRYLLFGSMAAV